MRRGCTNPANCTCASNAYAVCPAPTLMSTGPAGSPLHKPAMRSGSSYVVWRRLMYSTNLIGPGLAQSALFTRIIISVAVAHSRCLHLAGETLFASSCRHKSVCENTCTSILYTDYNQ